MYILPSKCLSIHRRSQASTKFEFTNQLHLNIKYLDLLSFRLSAGCYNKLHTKIIPLQFDLFPMMNDLLN